MNAKKYALFGIFTLSGFSGLIYESIWSHYLKLFLGHAAYAQTLVLAIFMGGMALGSWLVSRWGQRWRNLLITYLVIEGIIGLLGVIFHRSFILTTDLFFTELIPALGASSWIDLLKWGLGALLILPQSILLGMTFPLMSGGILRRFPERPGATLSLLYFTNSLGAALGVLASGFLLIPAVGLPGTILGAGLLNVLVALLVWMLVRHTKEPLVPAQPLAKGSLRPFARWLLGAAFLSGVASFLYEIAWIRMLSLVLGASTHAFELMLSVFILGLAFGGLWISRRADGLRNPQRFLGVLMMVMGSLAASTLWLYDLSFDWMAQSLLALSRTDQGYAAFNLISHGIAGFIMLPTTFCAGMSLPLMTHSLLKTPYGERAIGSIYAINTLGAIFGIVLAIHGLMLPIGLKGILLFGAALHLLTGLVFLARTEAKGLHSRTLALGTLWSVGLFALLLPVHLDPRKMTAGVFRSGQAEIEAGAQVLYQRDGKTATVALVQRKDGLVSILTNGKADAAIRMHSPRPATDEFTMILAGALPLALSPHPQRVANIGIGSGLTSHVLLSTGQVKRLDTVEIEPLMAEAARQGFWPRIRNLFEDPRSRIHFEDAKTFFATQFTPYDVIVSEPSNPWVSGVATLFSEEFYQRIRAYLKPDGLFVQWIQLYETDLSIVASIMKALSPHFSDYAIYNANDVDMIVVAKAEGKIGNLRSEPLQSPGLAGELVRIQRTSPSAIQAQQIGTKALLDPLFQAFPVPVNSDYFPFVDYESSRMRFLNRQATALTSIRSQPLPLLEMLASPEQAPPLGPDTELGKRTLRIQAALEGEFRALGPKLRQSAALLDLSPERCSDPSVRRGLWFDGVYQLFRAATPGFTSETAEKFWQRIESTPCYALLEPQERRPLRLWKAISRRDAVGMIAAGRAMLERGTILTRKAQQDLLIGATMLGYLAQQKPEAAQAIWARFGRRVSQRSELHFVLNWLRALSDAQNAEASHG